MVNKPLEFRPTHHDLSKEVRQAMVNLLQQHLADTLDLALQVKQAHWTVRGPQFLQLHELFDTLNSELLGNGDDLAERITALGGVPQGTIRQVSQQSTLPEYPILADGADHVKELVSRYAQLAKATRKAIDVASEKGDVGTADLFTGISRNLDKRLWFLEAHVS
jgi:starvation-inducible DNA-binding protein